MLTNMKKMSAHGGIRPGQRHDTRTLNGGIISNQGWTPKQHVSAWLPNVRRLKANPGAICSR